MRLMVHSHREVGAVGGQGEPVEWRILTKKMEPVQSAAKVVTGY